MPEYIDRCKECLHFQVCLDIIKAQLFVKKIMTGEENPECEDFVSATDVETVGHGCWINIVNAKVDTTGNCSECGEEAVWRTRNKPYFICPHCGAKMDRKDDENNA